MALFKRKQAPETTALDESVDAIIAYEDKESSAKEELADAERKLQLAYESDLDSAPPTDDVVAATARHRALQALRKEAESKGVGLIARAQVSSRERLAAVESELAETRRSMDARKIQTIAKFAQQHQFRVSWPSKQNGGSIHIPALSIDGEGLLEITDGVKAVVHVDPDAGQLDRLNKERSMLVGLIRSTPPAGLEMLVAERRKR